MNDCFGFRRWEIRMPGKLRKRTLDIQETIMENLERKGKGRSES